MKFICSILFGNSDVYGLKMVPVVRTFFIVFADNLLTPSFMRFFDITNKIIISKILLFCSPLKLIFVHTMLLKKTINICFRIM